MSNPRKPALSPLQKDLLMLLAQQDRENLATILNHLQCSHKEWSANAVLLEAGRALGGFNKLGYIQCESNLLMLKKDHFDSAGLSIHLELSDTGRELLNL